jgi:hypothetical protein
LILKQHAKTFFRAIRSALQYLNNLDRIANGTEKEPVLGAETAARLTARQLIFAQRKRLASDIVVQPIRVQMVESNEQTYLKAIEDMDHPNTMLDKLYELLIPAGSVETAQTVVTWFKAENRDENLTVAKF